MKDGMGTEQWHHWKNKQTMWVRPVRGKHQIHLSTKWMVNYPPFAIKWNFKNNQSPYAASADVVEYFLAVVRPLKMQNLLQRVRKV